MKKMIKFEMSRAIENKMFYVSLFIGLMLSVLHIIIKVIPVANNPLEFFSGSGYPKSVFNTWMCGSSNVFYSIYLSIFPIIATVPYATTYCSDRKNGYMKNILQRAKKSDYMVAKYITSFIFAGITVVIPIIVNLCITAAMLPSLKPVENMTFYNASGMFADIYYKHPYIYILLYILVYFMFAGVLATLSMTAYYFIENTFLVTLFPFVIYYAIGLLSSYTVKIGWLRSVAPSKILNMVNSYTTEQTVIILLLILGIFGAASILWGIKDDCM